MVDPNWGLLQGNNQFMNNFQMGVNLGDRIATTGRANALDNALSAFAKDPSQQNLNVIIDRDPRTGIQLQDQQRKSAAEQRRRELIPLAARGDENSLLELWGVDPDTAMKLDDNSKKKAVEGIKYVASAAYKIKQLPPDQRPAAWDAYIDQGMAQYPGLAQYKGKYSDQSLDSIVAQAGETTMFEEFQQPRYVPLGEQGAMGLQYGRPIPGGPTVKPATQQKAPAAPATKADYDKLPAGAQYIHPDGSIRTKQGGASSNASGGFRPVNDGVGALKRVFPNARVTSGYRDANHPLSKKNPDSFHTRTRAAADMAPIPGMTFEQAKAKFEAAGYYVHPDSRDEVNNPSSHATGPHWHFVIGER